MSIYGPFDAGRTTTTPERWLSVAGYEGYYEVSDQGRVRSVDRFITCRGGRSLHLRSVVLKHGRTVASHHFVVLSKDNIQRNYRVHRMVLEAFVGPCPEGMESLHWDDDKDNNTLSNLHWGTHSENMRDQLRNGIHPKASQTECQRGHLFTPDNIMRHGRQQQRLCRTCRQAWRLRRKLARSAVSV